MFGYSVKPAGDPTKILETYCNSFTIVSSRLQISDQDLTQNVQAGTIKKTNYFEKEASEPNAQIDKDEKEVKNQFSKLYVHIR